VKLDIAGSYRAARDNYTLPNEYPSSYLLVSPVLFERLGITPNYTNLFSACCQNHNAIGERRIPVPGGGTIAVSKMNIYAGIEDLFPDKSPHRAPA